MRLTEVLIPESEYRHRLTEVVALNKIGIHITYHKILSLVLNSFDDYALPYGMCKHRHGGDEGIVELIGKHIINKGLIDLYLIYGELLEIIEGRIARAEVVKGSPYIMLVQKLNIPSA